MSKENNYGLNNLNKKAETDDLLSSSVRTEKINFKKGWGNWNAIRLSLSLRLLIYSNTSTVVFFFFHVVHFSHMYTLVFQYISLFSISRKMINFSLFFNFIFPGVAPKPLRRQAHILYQRLLETERQGSLKHFN